MEAAWPRSSCSPRLGPAGGLGLGVKPGTCPQGRGDPGRAGTLGSLTERDSGVNLTATVGGWHNSSGGPEALAWLRWLPLKRTMYP